MKSATADTSIMKDYFRQSGSDAIGNRFREAGFTPAIWGVSMSTDIAAFKAGART